MPIDYEKMLEEILPKIKALSGGTVFFAKDLFEPPKWKSLRRGDKLNYGKYFKNKVKLGQVENVEYIGKADNNSALYKKL